MGAGTGKRLASLGLATVALQAPARAASWVDYSGDPLLVGAAAAGLGVFALFAFRNYRLARAARHARQRLGELEIRLNEAEAALAAEAHVLIGAAGDVEHPGVGLAVAIEQ